MEYRKAMMQGRLSSGLQADHGTRVHAVVRKKCKRPPCPYNDFGRKEIPNDDYEADVALCGARPGRRSVGWATENELPVDCPKCLKKLETKPMSVEKQIRAELKDLGYSPEVIQSGIAKTKRWMKAAYGGTDWEELQNETGNAIGTVIAYCQETQAEPEGINTFNRGRRV